MLLCLEVLLLLLFVLGLGIGIALLLIKSMSVATGIVAVMALTRDGLVRSLSVTGAKVPHNVPDFMFITPAKH